MAEDEMTSYQHTACSRAAALVAQAILLMKLAEIGPEVVDELKPYIRRIEKLK